jgi:hypothetical protein
MLQCVGGGQACVGGVAKQPEICNGADDNCNGITDTDTPGLFATCSANGVINAGACKATFICVPTLPGDVYFNSALNFTDVVSAVGEKGIHIPVGKSGTVEVDLDALAADCSQCFTSTVGMARLIDAAKLSRVRTA